MLKRTRSNALKKKNINISKDNYERILMWSMSHKEILFVCLGTKNCIEKVIRLHNCARTPKNYCFWSDIAFKWSVNRQAIACEKILAYGHSHPSKRHDPHPSKTDIKYSNYGDIELIAFPELSIIRGWTIQENLSKTLAQEVKINVVKQL